MAYSDSLIIPIILLSTGLLSYIQERKADLAVEKLKEFVRNKVVVTRQGKRKQINANEVVQGDMITLDAGDIIPADAVILESNEFHVNEAILTGESYPAEKMRGSYSEMLPITKMKNIVFKGTNVVSGSATILAIYTDRHTELEKIASSISKQGPDAAFEKGIRRFGFLLIRISIVIALLILGINILLKKPVIDSILFTLALTVGVTPELLPAILAGILLTAALYLISAEVIKRFVLRIS